MRTSKGNYVIFIGNPGGGKENFKKKKIENDSKKKIKYLEINLKTSNYKTKKHFVEWNAWRS